MSAPGTTVRTDDDGRLSVRTDRRQLLAAWNSIGSIDLGDGRKAELERLARILARRGSVVVPAEIAAALAVAPGGLPDPTSPADLRVAGAGGQPRAAAAPVMALTGLEVFAIVGTVAGLFGLGFALGEAAGEWYRGDDSGTTVEIVNGGDGEVEVNVD